MPSNFRFGRFELRPDERALLSDGAPLRLGGRAFDILLALVERRDRVVEFDELLDVVWPGLAVEENNLSVQVSTLRRLLGPDAISTVRGKGYRFTAPAREVVPGDEGAPPASARHHETGSVVIAIDLAGSQEPWGDILEGLGGRVVGKSTDGVCLVFQRARDGARAALKIQRHCARSKADRPGEAEGRARIGIAGVDASGGTSANIEETVQVAHALARSARAGEIVATADLVTEFVADVDGDVEDLGELALADGVVRAYRVRPAGEVRAVALPADAGALRPSIAILPFDCLVANAGDDVLGEALADDVITCLSRSPEFSVISGLSSRRLKRCGLSPANVGACLAASFLLSGSYKPTSDGISLTVHLQDARRGTVLRSIRLDATLKAAFDPADPLGARIAQEIGETVFSHAVQESKARPLPELESYSLLMGAIGLMHRCAVREFERARAMLEHLMQRQGCSGVATAWLAKWHVLRVVQGWSTDPSADARLALEYVGQSLGEDSRDALALSIGGLVHAYLRKDLTTAGQLYEQAIDANPSEPLAWLFSATRHAWLGRGAEADEAGERALRLSPIDPMKYFFDSLAATAALANSNFERSVALSQRSLKANCTHASTWRTLAIALVMLDRMDEARSAVQRLLAIEPGLTLGRFRERFPGRDGPLAEPFAEALKTAGVPE